MQATTAANQPRSKYSESTAGANRLKKAATRKTRVQGQSFPLPHLYASLTETETSDAATTVQKTEKEIQDEVQAIFRQITASVTFLPVLDGDCTFNVLVYADADSEVPMEWGDSDAKEIKDAEKVQLRSFSTNNHRVETLVSYRLAD